MEPIKARNEDSEDDRAPRTECGRRKRKHAEEEGDEMIERLAKTLKETDIWRIEVERESLHLEQEQLDREYFHQIEKR